MRVIRIYFICLLMISVVNAQSVDDLIRDNDLNSQDVYGISSDTVRVRIAEFDFCPRIRLRLVSGFGSRDYVQARFDSISKAHAIEDSIFHAAEIIRCKREKDSIKASNFSRQPIDSISILNEQSIDSIPKDNNLNSLDLFGTVQRKICDCDWFGPITVRTGPRIRGLIYTQTQLDSIQMAEAIADSICITRKIRCEKEKDSIRFAQFFEQHPDSTRLLHLTELTKTLHHKNIRQATTKADDFEKDSIQYIEFSVTDPFPNIIIGDYATWGIIRNQPEEIGFADRRKLDSLINILEPIDTKSNVALSVNPELSILIPMDSISHATNNGDVRNPDFSFYPNPASSFITLQVNQPSQMQLVDMNGKVVLSRLVLEGMTVLDVQEIGIGYYFLCLGAQRSKLLILR